MGRVGVDSCVELLLKLVATPSVSGNEGGTADIIEGFLTGQGVECSRCYNNVWAVSRGFDSSKPTLMLNSHHDTVKPAGGYTFDPYAGKVEDGRILGLGSNDAGASVVCLIALFVEYYDTTSLPFNLLLAITAEEETMGERGMRAMLALLDSRSIKIDMAIVGEPTAMQAAVGERGLVVLDGVATGKSGHAARNEGDNALYKAVEDIELLRNYSFDRVSSVLGDIKISVTQIAAGTQHNIVPDSCRFVVDVRTTDAYTNEQTVEMLQAAVKHSTLTPRSTRVRASAIAEHHPLVKAAVAAGRECFISPTTSDRALMSAFPALKIGVGESCRSHTADEFVKISEIEQGISIYCSILKGLANEIME
ncbi:MAG: M20/M25/M40 family metallo-hydrolase [Alistipes sp.]|nr:M20/M25/M40 family metallo-hydrolase [Alistipes sp.]